MSMERWRGRKQPVEGSDVYPFRNGPPWRTRANPVNTLGTPRWPVEAGVPDGPWNGVGSSNTGAPGVSVDITVTGPATADGRLNVWIEATAAGQDFPAWASYTYRDGHTADEIAAGLAAAIDGVDYVLASAVGPVVTVTLQGAGTIDLVQVLHAH